MKRISGIWLPFVSCFALLLTVHANEQSSTQDTGTLSEQDAHALDVGRKVIRIREALKHPAREDSVKVIQSLGLDSRYYVMVRGWITQHISMAESYRGVITYRESEEYKQRTEERISALKKLLRAIDLE